MSSLQDRLYNYEQTPPGNSWEKIAAALDESNLTDQFPSKLYDLETTPPASAWEKISSSLDSEKDTVIQVPPRSIPWFRYAAAAVITGIIAFSIIKWTGSNGNKSTVTKGLANTKQPSPIEENVKPGENTKGTNPEKENIQAEDNTPLIANTDPVKTPRTKKVKSNYPASTSIENEPIYAYNEPAVNLADRYVMLMTPNGIVRMSKKLGNFVCCVSGEEQDKDCKDQLKSWQEKLAASPAASTGNFMDILSLVSTLENEL